MCYINPHLTFVTHTLYCHNVCHCWLAYASKVELQNRHSYCDYWHLPDAIHCL